MLVYVGISPVFDCYLATSPQILFLYCRTDNVNLVCLIIRKAVVFIAKIWL
jgi:hypothetical protein